MTEGPCAPWPLDTSCCSEWSTYDPSLQTAATAWASEILYALSGRRFGTCPVTVRPCGSNCRRGFGWMTWPVTLDGGSADAAGGWFPYVDAAGVWRNCACVGACSCAARCELILPGPVASITEVSVDGVVVAPSGYRVDNGRILVRTDGECWPECQDFNESSELAEDTFFVTYERGEAVPVGGQIAAGKLACEYAKACTTGCKIPGNLASLTRQGVEVQVLDPAATLTDGYTGIHDVDLWLRSVNPFKRVQRPRLYSPDLDYPRVVSTP